MGGTLLSPQQRQPLQIARFTPASIPGAHFGIWAEGPKFKNQQIAADAAIETVADEVGVSSPTQGNAGDRPIYRQSVAVFNNRPAFDLTGFDRWVTPSWTALAQPSTIFAVAAFTTWTEGGGVFPMFDGILSTNRNCLLVDTTATPDKYWIYGGVGLVEGGVLNTTPHAFIAEFNSATSRLLVDGVLIASGDVGTNTLTGLFIGCDVFVSAAFNGHIALLWLWNRLLTIREHYLLNAWSRYWYRTAYVL